MKFCSSSSHFCPNEEQSRKKVLSSLFLSLMLFFSAYFIFLPKEILCQKTHQVLILYTLKDQTTVHKKYTHTHTSSPNCPFTTVTSTTAVEKGGRGVRGYLGIMTRLFFQCFRCESVTQSTCRRFYSGLS